MSQKYPSNWKFCATCVYWTGPREVDYWGKWITIDSSQTKGRCMCRSGSFRTEKPGGYTCYSFKKWEALE